MIAFRRSCLVLLLLPALGSCSSLDRFDTNGAAAYCGSLVRAPPFEEALVPNTGPRLLSARLTLDVDALRSGGETIKTVGHLTTDDRDRGLCSPEARPLVEDAPLRTIPELDHDPLSLLEFGEGRDYNFFAWVDSTCQGTLLAVVSLMRNEGVELRLLKPALLPAPDAPPERRPGFGLFHLRREEAGCDF